MKKLILFTLLIVMVGCTSPTGDKVAMEECVKMCGSRGVFKCSNSPAGATCECHQ